MTGIIDELEALAIDAAGGRWTVERSSGSWRVVNAAGEIAFDDGSAYNEYNEQCSEATRDYIVALHNGLPELLELAREALETRRTYAAQSELDQKVRKLCEARHPYLNKKFGGPGMAAQDEAELAEVERQIDEIQMAEMWPAHNGHDRRLEGMKSLTADLEKMAGFAKLCEWVKEYKPTGPECIMQSDRIQLALPELAEIVCEAVGYWKGDGTEEASVPAVATVGEAEAVERLMAERRAKR